MSLEEIRRDAELAAQDIDFDVSDNGAAAEPPLQLAVVTLDDFAAVDEAGADALVGDADGAVIPEDGDIMFYGDGGAGKTTLCVDLACHLAAGDEWLGLPVTRATRVLLVENEGPRPLFRAKLRRKRDGWAGSPLEDRLVVLEAPWGGLSFGDPEWQQALAATIRDREIDVVIVGPVTRSGMNEAGTLQHVRDFMDLVRDVRTLAARRVAFILVHHENKGGQVSGAWEGSGDTLFHVQGQGHGRTRLYVQKARWASAQHATTLHLAWIDGDGFVLEDKPELDDETIGEQVIAVIADNPGTGWTKVETSIKGVRNDRIRVVRDMLLRDGRLVNVVKRDGVDVALDHCPERSPARLYLADDPTINTSAPGAGRRRGAGCARLGGGTGSVSAPCAPPYRGRRRRGAGRPLRKRARVAMSDRPKQLTLDDEAATVDAVAEGFDEWSVFRAPMPKRRWRTVDELAARWRIGPEMAAGFLANFQAQGLAEERGGYWRATELARRRFRFLVGFGDEDEAAA